MPKMTPREKVCAVDLDGTILRFSFKGWRDRGMDYFGVTFDNARSVLSKLREDGWYILIFTCRTNPRVNRGHSVKELRKMVERLLTQRSIPFDEVYTGVGKPIADVYIDDRAIRYKNWKQVLKCMKKYYRNG